MVRDGALTLSDLRQPTIGVVCEPCGRRGRFNVNLRRAGLRNPDLPHDWINSRDKVSVLSQVAVIDLNRERIPNPLAMPRISA